VETMKDTKSSYLVPLIENVINDYITNKTQQTKSAVKYTLEKFAYDPFVRDILNIVNMDATSLQLEYNNSKNSISPIYSPVYYVSENVAVFNSFGEFYIKKSNVLSKLPTSEISKLPESFVKLCNILNDDRVEILDENIKIYLNKDIAIINENELLINGISYDNNSLTESLIKCKMMNKRTDIYEVASLIKEQFETIAEIDFGKRIFESNNSKKYADIFKLRDNIYINVSDGFKKTFYKGINPLEAKNIIKENINHDITSVFSSIIPKYEKRLKEINETKNEYLNYILDIEKNIEKFGTFNNETASLVIKELKEELSSVKNEFKEYNIKAEEYIRNKGIDEGLTLTIKDDVTGETQTIVLPGSQQQGVAQGAQNGMADVNTMTGMQDVNAMNLQQPTQQQQDTSVTYNDENSEMLGDNPSDPMDNVESDIEAEDIEKEAEDIEKEAEDIEQNNINDVSNNEEGEELKVDSSEELEKVDDETDEDKEQKLVLKKENVKESVNESLQIGDEITYKTLRGEISGKMLNGDLIVICHPDGKTYQVKESDITAKYTKANNPKQFKFDKETQKLLFEQNVYCGIFMGNIPVKLNECKVNYAEWMNASQDQKINVLVEGRNTILDKSNIKILEDVNNFANYENYKPCKILKENSIIDALVNMFDINTQDPILGTAKVLSGEEDNMTIEELPISSIQVLEEPYNTEESIISEMPTEVEFTIKISNLDEKPIVDIINVDDKKDNNIIEIAKLEEDSDDDSKEDSDDDDSKEDSDNDKDDDSYKDDDSKEDSDDDSKEDSDDDKDDK
ncbi:MAG: hypothetical protein RSF67_06170, partial [Clostridia bacterium]